MNILEFNYRLRFVSVFLFLQTWDATVMAQVQSLAHTIHTENLYCVPGQGFGLRPAPAVVVICRVN